MLISWQKKLFFFLSLVLERTDREIIHFNYAFQVAWYNALNESTKHVCMYPPLHFCKLTTALPIWFEKVHAR